MAKYRSEIKPHMIPVIKLARGLGYGYVPIACYYGINQGGIADVMMGRIGAEVEPATELPADFPPLKQLAGAE